MYDDPTPEVIAHIRSACDLVEETEVELSPDLAAAILGTASEMLSLVADSLQETASEMHPVARLPLPDVRGIVDALLDAGAHEHPVSATDVARALWHGEHLHGDVCRVGQRLRMMSAFGMVVRLAPPRDSSRPNRWSFPFSMNGGLD